MTVLVHAVDLGSTNVKVVLYDSGLRPLARASAPMRYDRAGSAVEFDPDALVECVVGLVGECAAAVGGTEHDDVVIALTGQAESLVLLDAHGAPVRPAMSWMDERADEEARELQAAFDPAHAFAVTGEPSATTTWPAAKLLWLLRHEPRSLDRAAHVLMVKDHVVQRLTGAPVGEETTRGFTWLWDVRAGDHWDAALDTVGVARGQLPDVVPAGTDLGPVSAEAAERLPAARSYRVNAGALDHFCAMVGTGSYRPGVVSESAGTVLSVSMLADSWRFDPEVRVSFHAGLRPGDVVLFNGADTGGVALEWFRTAVLADTGFAELEEQLASRSFARAPLFLPYLTGTNPPDHVEGARGAFTDLGLGHDRVDMAYAVEEGVAHLLRRNVDALTDGGVDAVVSTGGGAASAFWSQLKADVCGVDVVVPHQREATCRGAAALALLAAGVIGTLDDAAALDPPGHDRYRAHRTAHRASRYAAFEDRLVRLLLTPTERSS